MRKQLFETSLYLTLVRWVIQGLWFVSPANLLGWGVKRRMGVQLLWLPELYQCAVIGVTLCAIFNPPIGPFMAAFAAFRPAEIAVFVFDWVLKTEPVRDLRRSLIGFIVNEAEVVLCFGVLFMRHCGDSPSHALYNSLRTVVTIGPANLIECRGPVAAEIVVSYLITVVVIAAVIGKIARDEETTKRRT